jgi:hypothetical protein
VFPKLKDKPHSPGFRLDVGLETHREPESAHPLDDAIANRADVKTMLLFLTKT